MSFINDVQKGGIDPWQDHQKENPIGDGIWPINERQVRYAMRAIERDRAGRYRADEESKGDILITNLWKRESPAHRPCSAWGAIWPTVTEVSNVFVEGTTGTVTPPTRPPSRNVVYSPTTQQVNMGIDPNERHEIEPGNEENPEWNDPNFHGCRFAPPMAIRPMGRQEGEGWYAREEENYWTDQRFERKNPSLPRYGNEENDPVWTAFPVSYFGFTTKNTNEREQREIFLPADPRLIASAFAGAQEMSTMVCDLDRNFRPDPERVAWLHTFFRVGRGVPRVGQYAALGLPDEAQPQNRWRTRRVNNTLAWEIVGDDCGMFGGLVCENGFVDDDRGYRGQNTRRFAWVSAQYGGPFDVGGERDSHGHGRDQDGNKVNALHISTAALYRKKYSESTPTTRRMDGPMKFEGPALRPTYGIQGMRVPVHLVWSPSSTGDQSQTAVNMGWPQLGAWIWQAEALLYRTHTGETATPTSVAVTPSPSTEPSAPPQDPPPDQTPSPPR